MRLLNILDRVFSGLSNSLVLIAMLLLAAMAILINVEVLGRYVFRFSTRVSDEYSGYFFTWLIMASLLYVLRSGRMLRIDMVIGVLPPLMRTLCDIVTSILGVIVSVVLAYATGKLFIDSWMFGSRSLQYFRTPLYIPQIIMPLGFLLLALGYFETVLRLLFRIYHGQAPKGNNP